MQKIKYKKYADSFDSLEAMEKMIYFSAKEPIIKRIATILSYLKNRDKQLKYLFDFAYKNIYFEPDPKYTQRIRSAKRSLLDKRGNCVDYSVFFGSILLLLKIPFKLRMVKLAGSNQYTHVYIVTQSGIVLDAVIGQDQDGNEYKNRAQLNGKYNTEVPYTYKFDKLINYGNRTT